MVMPKRLLRLTLLIILLNISVSFSHNYRTVPANVWRLSVQSNFENYSWNIPNQPINLRELGRRYFDDQTIDENGFYSSMMDFVQLGKTPLDTIQTIGQYLDSLNQSNGFSLPAFSSEYFDTTQALDVSCVISEKRSKTLATNTYMIDYGLTDIFTAHLSVPMIQKQTISIEYFDLKSNEIQGLSDFISYHQNARTDFELFLLSNDYASLSANDKSNIQLIYNQLYSEGGDQSMLWALDSGENPLANGLFLSDFNPTTQKDSVTYSDLLSYYYPESYSAAGLGDISIGVSFLIYGDAPWFGKKPYAFFGHLSSILPIGKTVDYYTSQKDSSNKRLQFSSMSVGSGVASYQIGFGWNINLKHDLNPRWFGAIDSRVSIAEKLPTPIRLLGFGHTHPDSNVVSVGREYRFKPGDALLFETGMELFPDAKHRLSIQFKYQYFSKKQDSFVSLDSDWNQWMQSHNGYDTKNHAGLIHFSLWLHNNQPRFQMGPIPFNAMMYFSLPAGAKNIWSGLTGGFGLTFYFQKW
jgi:hypothetical protein